MSDAFQNLNNEQARKAQSGGGSKPHGGLLCVLQRICGIDLRDSNGIIPDANPIISGNVNKLWDNPKADNSTISKLFAQVHQDFQNANRQSVITGGQSASMDTVHSGLSMASSHGGMELG